MTPDPQTRAPSRAWILAALLTLYVVWGSTYAGIRVALESMPPFLMASTRYVLAGTILLGWVALRRGPRTLLSSRSEWLGALVTGALFIPLGNGGVVWGEQYGASGLAAVVVCTTPIWMALMGRFWLRERLGILTIAGLVLGLTGLAILVGPAAFRRTDLAPMAAFFIAALGWSAASVLSKRVSLPQDPLQASGMQILLGGLIVGLGSLFTHEHVTLSVVTPRAWTAFAYLTVVGAVLGFSVFLFLLKWAPISVVSTYAYVNPVVAIVLGVLFLGEALNPAMLVGGTIVVAAVALILAAQARERQEEADRRAARLSPGRAAEPV